MVRGDEPVRLGRKALAQLGGHAASLSNLGDDLRVARRVGDGRDSGIVAGSRGEQSRAADVDHLGRLVYWHKASADLRRKGAYVDGDDVDQPDLLGCQFGELIRPVASGEDAGVDSRVECLDLAAGDRLGAGQLGNGLDFDALSGQRVSRTVGCDDLDTERQEFPCEKDKALPVRYREQGSHQAYLPNA